MLIRISLSRVAWTNYVFRGGFIVALIRTKDKKILLQAYSLTYFVGFVRVQIHWLGTWVHIQSTLFLQ